MSRLLVMCVDALFTDDLADVRHLPGFSEILSKAAIYENVYCVYPTLTYVCHATIMTGCWPEHHGIPHNQRLDPPTRNAAWYWNYGDLKVKTLFDYAKQSGLTTGGIGWPVTAAAPSIDCNIPEIWTVNKNVTVEEAYRYGCSATGFNLYSEHKHLLDNNTHPNLEKFDIACLEQMIHEDCPDIILTHQAQLDHVRHLHGVHAPEVQDALRMHDEWIQRVISALKEEGLFEDTYFVILGDHGHLQVDYKISPNMLLERAGLLDVNEEGEVTSWRAYVQSSGISAQLFLEDPQFLDPAQQALKPLIDQNLISDVFTFNEAQERFHVAGEFSLMMEASANYAFGDDATGALVTAADSSDYKYAVSTHGHLPFRGEAPCFIVSGPGISSGRFAGARLIDEAPTLMDLVGIDYDKTSIDGEALLTNPRIVRLPEAV